MSKTILPFINLESGDRQISKNEIAMHLNSYFQFYSNIIKDTDTPFYENFFQTKNKILSISDDDELIQEIRKVSYFTEYDQMLQIVELFIMNKFFSYNIDSNLSLIGDVGDEKCSEKIFISGSKKYKKRDVIKYIRNALCHNDKKDMELYRLIQKQNNPQIYIEIYLRKPNFHIMLTIAELKNLLLPILQAKSAYSFLYYDNKGNIVNTPNKVMMALDKELYFEINQIYNFNSQNVKNKIITDEISGEKFKKKFQFNSKQVEYIKQMYFLYKGTDEFYNTIMIKHILEETIPFGMAKIAGYLDDLNNFLPFLYDGYNCLSKYQKSLNSNYQSKEDLISTERQLYNSINLNSRSLRANILFCSYILENITYANTLIKIDEKEIQKNYIRNSLVHGTYANCIDKDYNILLYDYIHKNKKGKMDNNLILENYTVNSFNLINLYKTLSKSINLKDYYLPLDLIINLEKFRGLRFTFREKKIIYYINASLDNKVAPFLGLKDVDGTLCYMSEDDFALFKNKVMSLKLNELYNYDQKVMDFIKKVPDIARISTTRFQNLVNEHKFTSSNYLEPLKETLEELYSLCKNYSESVEVSSSANVTKSLIKFYY